MNHHCQIKLNITKLYHNKLEIMNKNTNNKLFILNRLLETDILMK